MLIKFLDYFLSTELPFKYHTKTHFLQSLQNTSKKHFKTVWWFSHYQENGFELLRFKCVLLVKLTLFINYWNLLTFFWLYYKRLVVDTTISTFTVRRSRLEVFCGKGVLRNFGKFTGKHLRQSLFLIKLQETLAQVFSCEFYEIILFCKTILKQVQQPNQSKILSLKGFVAESSFWQGS